MELVFTPHPIIEAPTDEEILILGESDPSSLEELHRRRESLIELSQTDPLRYGFDLVGWERIRGAINAFNEVVILGGNRSGKTTGCAKILMEAVTNNDDGHVVCFSQNSETSIKVQQAAVWEMMPKEFRKKTRGVHGYINFSMQNGFTGSSFIFPDTRTRVDFKTYTQYSNDRTMIEGYQFGFKGNPELNVGAWLDEYLGGSQLVDTLRFRLATLNSKMIVGFTPIDGYTQFIADYLKGAETMATAQAELLNNREVPIAQYSPNREAAIIYMHTKDNPFGGYERLAKDLAGRPDEEILVRAYGVPVRSMTSLLPMFSTGVQVLGSEPNSHGMTFPDITDPEEYTVYQVVDPAGRRNFCALWAAVNEDGDVYIAREWPDRANYGEWATFGEKWKFGPASKKIGYDVNGYCELFNEIEEEMGVDVFERIGDSRYFARENENNLDLFGSFSDLDFHFVPSCGRQEAVGIQALDEWFSYNPNCKIDEANRPKCYIHEDCENLVESLINYNAQGKADEALKDFFDLIRYLRMANAGEGPIHYRGMDLQQTRGTGGY
jgi:hypothetical protein